MHRVVGYRSRWHAVFALDPIIILSKERRTIDAPEIASGGTSGVTRVCGFDDPETSLLENGETTRRKRSKWRFRWRKGKKLLFPLCSHDCLPAPVAAASSCIRSMDPRSREKPAELFATASTVLPFFSIDKDR